MLRLAWRRKRAGDVAAALALWQEAAALGEAEALRELAMHHEHKRREYAEALTFTDRALEELEGRDDPPSRRLAANFRRRRARLLRKRERGRDRSPERDLERVEGERERERAPGRDSSQELDPQQ
jgi:hypothetical protein